MLYPELELRLAESGRLADMPSYPGAHEEFIELLDHAEYGLALEGLAYWLADGYRPIPAGLRSELLLLAAAMEIEEPIAALLAFCPALL